MLEHHDHSTERTVIARLGTPGTSQQEQLSPHQRGKVEAFKTSQQQHSQVAFMRRK